jgi:hypothetical protein
LLSRIDDLLACQGFLECIGAATDLAVDDVIILSNDGGNLAANSVLLQVVHDARDFSYL